MNVIASAKFQLDWLPDVVFAGYTDDSDWNGFERPYFDRETAIDLLQRCEASGYTWEYDEVNDEFIVIQAGSGDDYREAFVGEIFDVGDQIMRLYPIGADSWIWGQTT